MSQEVIEITEREIEVIEVVEKGPAGPVGPQANINYTVVSSPQTLSNSQNIAADTSGGSFTLTLPANPNAGDSIDIFDYSETFDTNPLTIARNGENIESIAEDLICNVEGAYFTMIYTGATRGWQVLPRYGTSGGGGESALTTQGDMLYRGVGINTRLPIGSAGQILKVNSGATAPEWGAAPATGVTSVGVSGSDGIEVDSGSPVTGSGTIALGINAASLRSHINVADGANNYTHPNHSGEVTSSGDGATTIANDVVTNAKLANVATATIKGRATAGTGDPEDLSASQVRTILNVADGAEVNVQSNWTEADSGSDAFILNKPTLGTAAAQDSSAFAAASHTHAASDITSGTFTHERGGLEADVSAYNGLVKISGGSTSAVTVTAAGEALLDDADAAAQRTTLGLGNSATLDTGTTAGTVAEGDHTHELTALDATGATNGHVLTAQGDGTAAFAAASGGGVTGAASSASDVLGVSGSDITGVDATADRIVFWDDSASALKYLEAGSGLSISGTTLTATASGGSKTYAVFIATDNQPPASNYATLDTRNSIAVLDFDDATDESAVFGSIIPEGASLGSGLKIRLHWMATTATSGNVVWDVSLERMTSDLDSDSFDTIASGTAAANGTSGILTVTEITLTTIDSVTAGDGFRLKVTRDADNASDTMTGDAELVVVEVGSAA